MAARPWGLRLVITYKFVKAPVVLGIAAALTFAPASAFALLRHATAELSEWGALAFRLAVWLRLHATPDIESKAAALAWLDGVSTAIEGLLLWSGKAWGEWLVVAGLGVLIPFEIAAIVRHPSLGRLAVLGTNAVIVAYLAWRRVQAQRGRHGVHPPSRAPRSVGSR